MAPYIEMIDRIEAQETIRLVEALLAAGGRHMKDSDQRTYIRRLEQASEGRSNHTRERAPKITPAFAALLGSAVNVTITGGDSTTGRKEVTTE
jgi:hypothetical protein